MHKYLCAIIVDMKLFASILSATLPFAAMCNIISGLESYGDLTLVDEVDCATDATHGLRDYPEGASYVTNILGSACRAIAHPSSSSGYFSFRLGMGGKLEPHAMYLLVAEYPEDVPRTVTLYNKGQNSRNGFYTGKAVGISLDTILAQVRPESVGVPLSGGWARLEQTMVLNELVYPLSQPPDKAEKADRLVSSVENGFDVAFQVFKASAAPDSAGAAVRSIRLYRMNDEAGVVSEPRYPAGDVPRRLVTVREEMGNDYWYIANEDSLDVLRHKTRLMKSLGLNCFSRTMLEFGYDKKWDAAYSNEVCAAWWHDGWTADWRWATSDNSDRYSAEVDVFGDAGIYLLPYYEYAGGRGPSGLGYSSWRKAVPLFSDTGINTDTHQNTYVKGSNGASGANVDITQQAAYSDFERMLACTILRYRDRANFVGAWIRNRGSIPVSFSNAALASFCAETGRAAGSVTRASILDTIQGDATNQKWINLSQYGTNRWSSLYSEYRNWWYGKRADWLAAMQDYLEGEGGLADAKVFFTTTTGEAGPTMHEPTGNSFDYASGRAKALATLNSNAVLPGRNSYNPPYMAEGYNKIGLFVDGWNFWAYEYNHAEPAHDPQTYHSRSDVALTYPYDTVYSAIAGGPDFKVPSFRNASGDLFFARFLNLHEGCGKNEANQEALGYFTAEMDHAGRAVVLPELWGVLYQDPTVIGFLQGNQLARNFTAAFHEFAENFTALPAKPGSFVQGNNWWGANFGVRRYEGDGETLFAVVNADGTARQAQPISLGGTSASSIYEAVSGREHQVSDGKVVLDIKPYQLLALTTRAPDTPRFSIAVPQLGDVSASIPLDVSTLGSASADLAVAWSDNPDMSGATVLPVATLDSAGTNWVEIAGLSPNTRYWATFGLTNALARGSARVISFSTGAPAAWPEVSNMRIEALDASHATLRFSLDRLGDGCASATFHVALAAAGHPELDFSIDLDPIGETGDLELPLTGLSSELDWTAVLTADNANVSGVQCGSAAFATPPVAAEEYGRGIWEPGLRQHYGEYTGSLPDFTQGANGQPDAVTAPGAVMARLSSWTDGAGTAWAWDSNKKQSFHYEGVMWFDGGKTYVIDHRYDDGTYVFIDGSEVGRNPAGHKNEKFDTISFKDGGWHWIRLVLWNAGGAYGPYTDLPANVSGEESGFVWNDRGSKSISDASIWHLFEDPGDGSLLRTYDPVRTLVTVSSPVATESGVMVPVSIESWDADSEVTVFCGNALPQDPHDAAAWDAQKPAAVPEPGTSATEWIAFDGVSPEAGGSIWAVAHMVNARTGHDAWSRPVRIADTGATVSLSVPTAEVSPDGSSATLAVTVERALFPDSTVTLTVNGSIAKTWEGVTSGETLVWTVPAKVGRTDTYEFAISSAMAGTSMASPGSFVSRRIVEWFDIELGSGYRSWPFASDGGRDPIDGGMWNLAGDENHSAASFEDGRWGIVFNTGDGGSVDYIPSSPSGSGLHAVASGRMLLCAYPALPDVPSPSPIAAFALVGNVSCQMFGWTADGWVAIGEPTFPAESWVDWQVDFRFGEGTVEYSFGNPPAALAHNGVSRLPAGNGSACVSSMTYAGYGEIGDFAGIYIDEKGDSSPELETFDARIGGGSTPALSFTNAGTDAETFSISLSEATPGIWYAAFACATLSPDMSDWTCVSCVQAEGTEVALPAHTENKPACFFRVFSASGPIDLETPLSELLPK